MALKLIDNLLQYIDNKQITTSEPKEPKEQKEQKEEPSKQVTPETYTSLRAELESLINEKGCAAILVRLAWHDAGTFCAKTNTGGPRAAQRFEDGESKHGANAGLTVARGLLSTFATKYCNDTYNVSTADLWALAGNTAIACCGGPDILFEFGRRDIPSAAQCVEEGRLPDGDKGLDHLRAVFNRMNFNDREIVALSGAHTLGSCHADRSGFEGFWTAKPLKFDNSYFVDIMNKKWVADKSSKGNVQLKVEGDDKDKTMMLTTDYCLFERAETKGIVEEYAKDEKVFFNDFSAAWRKLITGGYTDKDLYTVTLNK